MSEYCCVPGCKSYEKKNPQLSFHRFPQEGRSKVRNNTVLGSELQDRRKMWEKVLNMGKKASLRMVVCSLHFIESDFFKRHAGNAKRRYLKLSAVPSINLPVGSHEKVIPTAVSKRSQRFTNRTLLNQQLEENTPCIHSVEEEVSTQTTSDEREEAAEALMLLLNNQPQYKGPKTFKDFCVQVNTPSKLTVCDLIKTENALTSFTGLQNFNILEFILKSVNLVYKDSRSHRISVKERIILTFMKLKCDLSFVNLGILFQISSVLCKTYFVDMLQILYKVLQPSVYFPTKKEIDRNMPTCFEDFKDTQMVLDCTEIFVQKPKCLCCRIKFYSSYKSSQTVKFITGVTPAGLISYVSKPYGGRASDKGIFIQSNIIEQFEKNVAVMVDKGFLIDDICASYGIRIHRPPFLEKKNNFLNLKLLKTLKLLQPECMWKEPTRE